MKYEDHIGIMFDTIFFGVIYFNSEKFKEYTRDIYGTDNDILHYFEVLNQHIETVPDKYLPFFYLERTRSPFLTNYMVNNFYLPNINFDDIINSIKNDKDLKKKIFKYFIDNENIEFYLDNENMGGELIDLIFNLEVDFDLKKQLIKLYYDFNNCINDLSVWLLKVYPLISTFHKSLYIKYKQKIRDFSSDKMLNYLTAYVNINKHICSNLDFSKQIMGVSYLNPYMFYLRCIDYSKCYFIFGLHSETTMLSLLNLEHLSYDTVLEVLANPIRRDIIDCLSKKEYTSTQLAEILPISRQSVSRHMNFLHEKMAIKISKKNSHETYYTLNKNFFQTARLILNDYFSELENKKIFILPKNSIMYHFSMDDKNKLKKVLRNDK